MWCAARRWVGRSGRCPDRSRRSRRGGGLAGIHGVRAAPGVEGPQVGVARRSGSRSLPPRAGLSSVARGLLAGVAALGGDSRWNLLGGGRVDRLREVRPRPLPHGRRVGRRLGCAPMGNAEAVPGGRVLASTSGGVCTVTNLGARVRAPLARLLLRPRVHHGGTYRPRDGNTCRNGDDTEPEKRAGTALTVAVPDDSFAGARTVVAAAPVLGATAASPIAAAAEAPAARPATIAARRGDRCSAGAAGGTVGTRSWRTVSGASGMGGTALRCLVPRAGACSSGDGPCAADTQASGWANARSIDCRVGEKPGVGADRRDVRMRRSSSAACRHTRHTARCWSKACSVCASSRRSTYALTCIPR